MHRVPQMGSVPYSPSAAPIQCCHGSQTSPAFLPHALFLQPACSLSLVFVKSHLSLIPSNALSEEFCSPYFTWELSHSFPES